MSDKELEEYFKTVNPNFEYNAPTGTIKMSNEYYNLLEERMVRLINENRQLKNDNAVMKANLIEVSDKQRDLYKDVIDEARNFVEHYRFYAKINNYDYLKDSNEAGELDEQQVDELLQILDKVKGESNG